MTAHIASLFIALGVVCWFVLGLMYWNRYMRVPDETYKIERHRDGEREIMWVDREEIEPGDRVIEGPDH